MCCLLIGNEFHKKITPILALYPSSKNTDSDVGGFLPPEERVMEDSRLLDAAETLGKAITTEN